MDIKKIIIRIKPSVFEISDNSVIGTGFLLKKDCIITCKHVLEDKNKKIRDKKCFKIAYNFTREGLEARGFYHIEGISVHPTEDIALIHVNKTIKKVREPVTIGYPLEIMTGETVFLAGFPLGKDIQETNCSKACSISKGIVSNVVSNVDPRVIKHFILDINAHPGCSGGPVFLENGEVIGILSAGHPVFAHPVSNKSKHIRICIGYAIAIPIHIANDFYEDKRE